MVDTPEDYMERRFPQGFPKERNPFYDPFNQPLEGMPPGPLLPGGRSPGMEPRGLEPRGLPPHRANPFLPHQEYIPSGSGSGGMPSARLNALRSMTGLPPGMIPAEDPEDVLSTVPFLPPDIPSGFMEEMENIASLARGKWGVSRNFVPGMALPLAIELESGEIEDIDPLGPDPELDFDEFDLPGTERVNLV